MKSTSAPSMAAISAALFGQPDRVELRSITSAQRVGFGPIKSNAVSIRGITEHEVVPLANYARQRNLEMRFIEYMPIGAEAWERDKVYFAHEILEQLEREVAPLVPAETYDPRAPAMEFRYTDGGGRVGIIASVSRPARSANSKARPSAATCRRSRSR